MAFNYAPFLKIDDNLYAVNPNASPIGSMTAADIEKIFPDGELVGDKIGNVGASTITSGQLRPGEAITVTDGSNIRILIGFQQGGF